MKQVFTTGYKLIFLLVAMPYFTAIELAAWGVRRWRVVRAALTVCRNGHDWDVNWSSSETRGVCRKCGAVRAIKH